MTFKLTSPAQRTAIAIADVVRVTASVVAWTDGRYIAIGFYVDGSTPRGLRRSEEPRRTGREMIFDTHRPLAVSTRALYNAKTRASNTPAQLAQNALRVRLFQEGKP